MTMVSSGSISIGGSATCGGLNRSINIELGRGATTSSNLNESALRTLAGVPSGQISMSNFYGKSNAFPFTISVNQNNANLRTLAVNAGWNQSSSVVATINAGVTIRSTSTGTPALTVNGAWPGGVRLINNGTIFAQGGAGGGGGRIAPGAYGGGTLGGTGQPGFAGGTALAVSVPITIQNAGTIAGGGGGGGGSTVFRRCNCEGTWAIAGSGGGGGSGCGAGGPAGVITPAYPCFGSVSPGPVGGPAGSAASSTGGGAGGPGGNFQGVLNNGGGPGGGRGAAGTAGPDARNNQGPWVPRGFSFCYSRPGLYFTGPGQLGPSPIGGAAGPAVTGNGFISWQAFGTRQGPIS